MKRILNLVITGIIMLQSFVNLADASPVFPMIDSPSYEFEELPRNWRTTKKSISDPSTNLLGLNNLQVSGSAQFNEKAFVYLTHKLPNVRIIVLDLRQESHLIVNGTAISWTDGQENRGNSGKTLNEIERDEQQRLEQIKKEGLAMKNSPISSHEFGKNLVQTEKELVESLGHTYIRLPVADHNAPSDATVDQYVALIKSLGTNDWVHVHCKAGKGRTTTFMTVYDIMKNAQSVALMDILSRQKLLGGTDLTHWQRNTIRDSVLKKRFEFIKNFYRYCKEVPLFDQKWSEWVAALPNAQLPINAPASIAK
ncbi:MAG: dual specificity protein phosphatase family protein [Candidatus Protochlamydia sp.]|nr:dual specificity protein phosphatase family protein [Candidatus Protochlamydia sp.]